MRPIYRLVWTFLPLLVSLLIGYALKDAQQEIYTTLILPAWMPASWIFSVVWPVLYIMIGYASFMIYDASFQAYKFVALTYYFCQLAFNFFWNFAFFMFQSLSLALFWCGCIILLSMISAFLFYRIRKAAGWLMIPYIAWLCFAFVLNASIVFLNI